MKKEDALKCIQLYTGCDEFAVKRIAMVLDKLQPTKIVHKTIYEERVKYIQKLPVAANVDLPIWAEEYFKFNGITLKEVKKRSRDAETISLRNRFCIAAYGQGYSYSSIGRYLGLDHATIIHAVNKIKSR